MAKINVRDRNKGTGRQPNWEYRFEIASVGGKRQSAVKSGFRTKKDALEAGTKALAEYYRSGEHFTPSKMSVSDYFDFWLENYGKNHWKDTTLQSRTYIVERNIKPVLGKYRLASISSSTLQTFINRLRGKSKSYITGVLATIHVAFQCAVFPFGFIKTNPAQYVTPPLSAAAIVTKERPTITQEEFKKIITKYPFGTTYYIPLMLGWHCGLRISETLGLTWDSVDFSRKIIIINIQVNQLANKGNPKRKVSFPKYGSSRVIPLDNEMLEALEKEHERQLRLRRCMGDYYHTYTQDTESIVVSGGDTMDFVCRNKYGDWISMRSLNHTIAKIKLLIGKPVSYHSFRHSHATILLACGVNPKIIQQRLGHRKMSTTLDVYTHASLESQIEAIDKIQKAFQSGVN